MKPNGSERASSIEHRSSSLLTRSENENVFKLLGNRCQALSTTVIQLFTTDGPGDTKWHKRCFGILCLVKDNSRRSYFFRLYCLVREECVWEHELYKGMDYMAPQNFLHIFEAEDCIVAFNFANEEEARYLRNVILEKQKRLERRRRSSAQSRHSSAPGLERDRIRTSKPHSFINGTPSMSSINQVPPASGGEDYRKPKRRGNKLTKADISSPTEFRHVSYVRFDPNKGFESKDNPELERFFQIAGVSQSQLRDPRTSAFIYDFLERNGGLDAAKEEALLPPPTVPPRNTNNHPSSARHRPPPPPMRPPPSSIQSNVPPPLPPLGTMPSRTHESSMHIPPPPLIPPPMVNVPPPPSLPPPEVKVPPPAEIQPDNRSALMDSIRSGIPLKHFDPESDSKNTVNSDIRGDLLDQIRQGTNLKPVQPVPKPQTSEVNGLAGALARALAERSRAIHSDSSDTSEDNDEDDEWDN